MLDNMKAIIEGLEIARLNKQITHYYISVDEYGVDVQVHTRINRKPYAKDFNITMLLIQDAVDGGISSLIKRVMDQLEEERRKKTDAGL